MLETVRDAIRVGTGIPLPLVVRLQTDPSTLRNEWRALDLVSAQLACVLLLWVDPVELTQRMTRAAAFLNGERHVPIYLYRGFEDDPYGIRQVEIMTGSNLPDRGGYTGLPVHYQRKFFDSAEATVRIAVTHMLGRTDRLDAISIHVRYILLGDEPPSMKEIVAAAGRWRQNR